MIRSSKAVWKGSGKEGKGELTSTSGVLKTTPYSFHSRFESEDGKAGTNPEELIAAAHAACYSMALSHALAGNGTPPESVDTKAVVGFQPGVGITGSELTVVAKVPGLTEEEFLKFAEDAKTGCPISKLLNAEITLDLTVRPVA